MLSADLLNGDILLNGDLTLESKEICLPSSCSDPEAFLKNLCQPDGFFLQDRKLMGSLSSTAISHACAVDTKLPRATMLADTTKPSISPNSLQPATYV